MDWNEVGAIGQMLGSIAVFITLVYLAAQTRLTRREVQRSITQTRTEGARQLLMHQADNNRLVEADCTARKNWGQPTPLFIATMIERGGVSESDAWAMNWDQIAWWVFRDHTIEYIDELAGGERFQFDASVRSAYGPSTWQRFWYENQKRFLNPNAVRYVDNLLAQQDSDISNRRAQGM